MIVGIAGKAGSGKDTIADLMQDCYPKTLRYAFADEIKTICCLYFDWTEEHVNGALKDVVVKVSSTNLGHYGLGLRLTVAARCLGLNPREVCSAFFTTLNDFSDRGEVSPREVMQYIGTEVGRGLHPEFWVKTLMAKIAVDQKVYSGNSPTLICFITDVRFDSEAIAVRATGGVVIEVSRGASLQVRPHVSEKGLSVGLVSKHIENNCDLDTLKLQVLTYLQHRISATGKNT